MKLKSLFILAFLIITSTIGVNAQTNSLYYEGFSSGSSWPLGNSDIRNLEVKNGKYYFEHKRDSKSWNITTRDIDIDTNKDFVIETSIRKVSGDKNHAFGLLFGTKDSENTFQFVLSNDQYRVSEERNGTYTSFKNWTTSSSIKTSFYSYNKLKIKKTKNTLYFYINDTYLTSMDFKPFFGKKIGLLVYNQQKIAVDYLSVKQDSKTVVSNGKSLWYDDFSSNPNSWAVTDNEKAKLEVRNNKYYFDHKRTSGGWSSTKIIDLDTERDYEIEAKILKISGIQNNGFGFVFGRKDSDNQYVFIINANGSYAIDKYENGEYTALKKWTESKHIKKGNYAYNTLKIVRDGKWVKFYVNNRYLTLFYHKSFFGKRIGFVVYEKQKIAIDDFKVSYVKDNTVIDTDIITDNNKSIWKDNFNSNTHGWATNNTDKSKLEVKNSKYYFEHKRASGGWSSTKIIDINTSRDFKIEGKFLEISGIKNMASALFMDEKIVIINLFL